MAELSKERGFRTALQESIGNEESLKGLLSLAKERRGVDRDKLIFIGMADVAGCYWCAMKSLLQNKRMELGFFSAYLHDRLLYSFQLGYIGTLPKSEENLLETGDEIGFEDIEKLLGKRGAVYEHYGPIIMEWVSTVDKDGKKVRVINPMLPPERREAIERQARGQGERVADVEEFPSLRGRFLHMEGAERYPTIRWNFGWKDYVVLGVPDGITDTFVYEFKTTKNEYLASYFVKPVAFAQADLYGYFWRRNKKRVQIRIVDGNMTRTWQEEVDETNAIKTLENFRSLDEGAKPIPPKKWKCKPCQFRDTCDISKLN